MGRFQNNPSSGWMHPKSTHAHPLTWANKKLTKKPITLSIQPTFDSLTFIPVQKVFPQWLCRTEPIKSQSSCPKDIESINPDFKIHESRTSVAW
jgi:hypothetical protein